MSWEPDDDLDKLLDVILQSDYLSQDFEEPKAKDKDKPVKKPDISSMFSANKESESKDASKGNLDDKSKMIESESDKRIKNQKEPSEGAGKSSDKLLSNFFTSEQLENIKSSKSNFGGGGDRNLLKDKDKGQSIESIKSSKDDWLGLDKGSSFDKPFSNQLPPSPMPQAARKLPTRESYDQDFGFNLSTKLGAASGDQASTKMPFSGTNDGMLASGDYGPSSLTHPKQLASPLQQDNREFGSRSELHDYPSNKGPITSQVVQKKVIIPQDPQYQQQHGGGGMDILSILSGSTAEGVKKKVKSGSGVTRKESLVSVTDAKSSRGTLQVPSHLIDENELKAMTTSLDILYKNQLKMIEKSYKEQIESLEQSHSRKEEHLRSEIQAIHKEFEGRLDRLKQNDNEGNNGTSSVEKMKVELIDSISNLSSHLSVHFKDLSYSIQQQQQQSVSSPQMNISQEILPNIENIFIHRILPTLQNIEGTMSKLIVLQQNSQQQQQSSGNEGRLELIVRKLDSLESRGQEDTKDQESHFKELEGKLTNEMSKLGEEQSKLKDSVIKSAVSSLTQVLQSSNEFNGRKRDKVNRQLKELRRDFRKLLFDFDSKNGSIQTSQVAVESDQKQILQNLRGLHNLVIQMNNQSNFNRMYGHRDQVEERITPEYELKLLNEERKSMAESLAKINVERQKLNEDRLNAEKSRIELDMERNRLRDFETELKFKIKEAEDMKRRASESCQEESKLMAEASMKMNELERERFARKEQFSNLEQQFRMREHKIIQEKTELLREHEFLEKLRIQLLCPACLKSHNSTMKMIARSDGDGLDLTNLSGTNYPRFTTNASSFSSNTGNITLEKEKRFLQSFSFAINGND